MKNILKLSLIIIIISAAITFCGCAKSAEMIQNSPFYPTPEAPSDDYTDYEDLIDIIENQDGPLSGQLTAAELHDNENYLDWVALFDEQSDGEFAEYIEVYDLVTIYRIKVNVFSGEEPVKDAKVELLWDGAKIFTARTDNAGTAYLFMPVLMSDAMIIKVTSGQNIKEVPYTYSRSNDTVDINMDGSIERSDILEIMFVIDTTGSMSDELEYLKSEIKDVIESVATENSDAVIRIALLFYRDVGDDYVTRYFDFTTDINEVCDNISDQSAEGGGDYPEAVHSALDEAMLKNWSDNATRLLIHVLDAPPHSENIESFSGCLRTAAGLGIRMIPVASSGINSDTEYLLRSEAVITGGTYVFLTDDSGIGNGHLEPETEEDYTVEYLNALLIRLINEYYNGSEIEPIPYYQQ